MTRFGLASGFVLLLASSALAQPVAGAVCVNLDETRDTLPPDDRRAAAISFGQALAKNNLQVVSEGCGGTYTIYNVKLGNTITVYVVGPTGTIQGRANKVDELPMVYEQMAHSIATGQPMGSEQNVDRTNATSEQMAPRRIQSDNLKYLRLGYGAVTGPATGTGPSFGIGWRFEMDRLALEVSAFDLTVATTTDSMGQNSTGVSGDWIKLSAYLYQTPLANASLYYGAGLGYGSSNLCTSSFSSCYSGNGLEGVLSVGYEILRQSTIRMLFQVDVQLPTYMDTLSDFTSTGMTVTDRRYVPTIALSVGIGWGRSNTIRVIQN
jgi:hypothetical protein